MPSNNNNTNNDGNTNPSFMDKVSSSISNCCASTGLCCFKVKEQGHISLLEQKIATRKKKFGVDYIDLIQGGASPATLRSCVKQAMDEIELLEKQVDEHHDKIGEKEGEVEDKKKAAAAASRDSVNTPPPAASKNKDKPAAAAAGKKSPAKGKPGGGGGPGGGGDNKPKPKPAGGKPAGKPGGGGGKPAAGKGPGGGGKKPAAGKGPGGGGKKPAAGKGPGGGKPKSPAGAAAADVDDEFANADPKKWKLSEMKYGGSVQYDTVGKQEKVEGKSIPEGIEKFKSNPTLYTAMMYQSTMVDWPIDQQKYTLIHRSGTKGYHPKGVSPKGWMTILIQEYQALPPLKDNQLPSKFKDKYTDNFTHLKRKIHSKSNIPILPGRGMGCCDSPNIKIIGDVDPSDIHQGSVGDCWLLSGISSLAEFDGAIKKLFRKTSNLESRPLDTPNQYTITLWDLSTWKEVDIVIDERLCVNGDGSGQLLASKPSEDGELWVCYLEKALAAHCGGWDKITGGQCTHAWALMTGCKEQYTISKNPKTGKYVCCAKYNPYEKKWSKHANSPHDGDGNLWRVAWPEVGGGGDMNKELTEEELFMKMYAWDRENYIVGAGTSGTSDTESTGGMVDNHAYSVIECRDNVAGTEIDLLKVRNPWGKGEIEDGEFDDDGPGWDRYPQVKRELNPVVADDGIFWVTKKEFFQFFQTIYLSASNMTEFLED